MNHSRRRLLMLAAAASAVLVVVDHWPGDDPGPAAARNLAERVIPAVQAASAAEPDVLDTRPIVERVADRRTPGDAFAARSWTRPPPPPPPAPPAEAPPPPPPPQAPPLPFKYLGRLEETAERTQWYLGLGERVIVAGVGDTIDGTYRVEGFEAGRLRLTYLPLDIQQQLPMGAAP